MIDATTPSPPLAPHPPPQSAAVERAVADNVKPSDRPDKDRNDSKPSNESDARPAGAAAVERDVQPEREVAATNSAGPRTGDGKTGTILDSLV